MSKEPEALSAAFSLSAPLSVFLLLVRCLPSSSKLLVTCSDALVHFPNVSDPVPFFFQLYLSIPVQFC